MGPDRSLSCKVGRKKYYALHEISGVGFWSMPGKSQRTIGVCSCFKLLVVTDGHAASVTLELFVDEMP